MQVNLTALNNALAGKRWNWRRLAIEAKKPYSTIRRLFTVGSGHVDTIDAVSKALDVTYESLVAEDSPEERTA